MGVAYDNKAVYVCDQTGEEVTMEGDMIGAPEGWISFGALWFKDWAAVRDYAAAQVEEPS